MSVAVDPRLVEAVLTKSPLEVGEILKEGDKRMGKAQFFEQLTEVRNGLSLIMVAVKKGSTPTVEAVFAAMVSVLDDDQVRVLEGTLEKKWGPLYFTRSDHMSTLLVADDVRCRSNILRTSEMTLMTVVCHNLADFARQLTRVFAGGIPSRNLQLLFLAAEGGDRDVFDAALGVLHRVAKVAHKIDKGPLDPNEHSGGRWSPTDLHGEAEGKNR